MIVFPVSDSAPWPLAFGASRADSGRERVVEVALSASGVRPGAWVVVGAIVDAPGTEVETLGAVVVTRTAVVVAPPPPPPVVVDVVGGGTVVGGGEVVGGGTVVGGAVDEVGG